MAILALGATILLLVVRVLNALQVSTVSLVNP